VRKTEESKEHNHRRCCPWEHAYCVFFFIFLTVELYGCVERLIVLEHSGGVSGELFLQ
jgi:hypothetical protein